MLFAVSGLVAMAVMIGTLGLLAARHAQGAWLTPGERRLYQSALYSVLAIMLFSAAGYRFATGNLDITIILLLATFGLFFVARPNFLPVASVEKNEQTMQAGLAEMRARKMQSIAQPESLPFVDNAGRSFTLRSAHKDGTLTLSAFTTDNAPAAIGYVDLSFARDYGESRAILTDIFVRDDYRRAGIATYLLGAAERAAREGGATKIVGQSDDSRFWARQPGWNVEGNAFYKNV